MELAGEEVEENRRCEPERERESQEEGLISKAEFQWFSAESRRLISKILMADLEKRVTIRAIMWVPWFMIGFSRPFAFQLEEPVFNGKELQKSEPANPRSKPSSPNFFNAFEFISSMSFGFDLSGLFESKRKTGSMFTSKYSTTAIVSKIEMVARGLSFKVGNEKGFEMRLQGPSEGRKGRLTVIARCSRWHWRWRSWSSQRA